MGLFALILGILAAGVLGVLIDWLLKPILPEKPQIQHSLAVIFAITVLVVISAWSSMFSPDDLSSNSSPQVISDVRLVDSTEIENNPQNTIEPTAIALSTLSMEEQQQTEIHDVSNLTQNTPIVVASQTPIPTNTRTPVLVNETAIPTSTHSSALSTTTPNLTAPVIDKLEYRHQPYGSGSSSQIAISFHDNSGDVSIVIMWGDSIGFSQSSPLTSSIKSPLRFGMFESGDVFQGVWIEFMSPINCPSTPIYVQLGDEQDNRSQIESVNRQCN